MGLGSERSGVGAQGARAFAAALVLAVVLVPVAQAADGTWERAWGRNVDSAAGTGAEICTVAASCQAGQFGGLGGELGNPTAIATDAAGNVYVAGFQRIDKFDSLGNWERGWGKDVVQGGGTGFEICTVASECQAASEGVLGGELSAPQGIAVDAAGAVYVVDNGNQRIQKYDSSGNWQRAWGKDVVTGGSTGFEICTAAANCQAGTTGGLGGELNFPLGIAADGTNAIYVGDFENQRIQKFDSAGNFQRAWGKDVDTAAGTGFEICTAAASCQAGTPGGLGGEVADVAGLATDPAGAVYVAEDRRIQKFDSSGNWQRAWGKDVVTGGGTGFEICIVAADCKAGVPGGLGGEFFSTPTGAAADSAGAVYVTDGNNHRIQKFDSSGNWQRAWGKDVDTAAGTGFEICTVAASCKAGTTGVLGGEFNLPSGAATDAAGALYVADRLNARVQKFAAPPAPPPPPEDGGGDGVDATPPDTTITKKPKDKTKKKTATFEFTSTEPGSTFECSLDDGPFQACTSPDVEKVKKGKHTFEVRAKDAAGNDDATPATDSWKVKKKKKK